MYNACFQRDIAYPDFKGLPRRTSSDKAQFDKAFNIAKKIQNIMDVNVNLFQCRKIWELVTCKIGNTSPLHIFK